MLPSHIDGGSNCPEKGMTFVYRSMGVKVLGTSIEVPFRDCCVFLATTEHQTPLFSSEINKDIVILYFGNFGHRSRLLLGPYLKYSRTFQLLVSRLG